MHTTHTHTHTHTHRERERERERVQLTRKRQRPTENDSKGRRVVRGIKPNVQLDKKIKTAFVKLCLLQLMVEPVEVDNMQITVSQGIKTVASHD